MTKIIIRMGTGYCGEDACEVIDVDYTLDELKDRDSPEARKVDEIAYYMSIDNAEMYGHEDDDLEERVDSSWEIFYLETHEGELTMDECDRLRAELEDK